MRNADHGVATNSRQMRATKLAQRYANFFLNGNVDPSVKPKSEL